MPLQLADMYQCLCRTIIQIVSSQGHAARTQKHYRKCRQTNNTTVAHPPTAHLPPAHPGHPGATRESPAGDLLLYNMGPRALLWFG